MTRELSSGLRAVAVTLVGFGVAYHVLVWGVAQVFFPQQAAGSLVRAADGTAVGSTLIAQRFVRSAYFHPRPSAVGYDAAASGGSNHGPGNPDYRDALRQRADAIQERERVRRAEIHVDMLTASGSGLDPHISPPTASLQVARVAAARGLEASAVGRVVEAQVQPPLWGFFGKSRINVLELNRALDEAFGRPHAEAARGAHGATR